MLSSSGFWIMKPANFMIETTTKEKDFDILEKIVWDFNERYKDHLPTGWEANVAVLVSLHHGYYQRLDKVYFNGEEVGAVLVWVNEHDPEGTEADSYETFEEAFISMAIGIVGEEKFQDFLSE